MILKKSNLYKTTNHEVREVREWNTTAKGVVAFKKKLYNHNLEKNKGRCAFCELELNQNSTRRKESLDHFIPKSIEAYPAEWRFDPYNLLPCCSVCNEILKKNYNPVHHRIRVRSKLRLRDFDFLICHPYLDDVQKHIEIISHEDGFIKLFSHITPKGEKTITLFRLNNFGYISNLSKQNLFDKLKKTPREIYSLAKDLADDV